MEFTGTGIGQGVAVGTTLRMPEPLPEPGDAASERSPEEESARASASMSAVARDLEKRGEQAGGTARDVLEAQAMMAEDPSLVGLVSQATASGKTAERAVFEAFASFRDQLVAMGGYLGERAADLDDVSQRVIAHLQGVAAPGVPQSDERYSLAHVDMDVERRLGQQALAVSVATSR